MKRIGLTLTALILAVAVLLAVGGYRFLFVMGPTARLGHWLSVEPGHVRAIVLDARRGVFRLEHEDNRWNAVSEGVRTRADGTKVSALLDYLNNSRPVNDDVREEALAQYGLDSPVANLTLLLEDGSKVEFRFGASVPSSDRIFVWSSAREGGVYEMDARGLKLVERPMSHFEDTRLMVRHSLEDVSSIQLAMRYGAGWKLIRANNGFVFELPGYLQGKPASQPEVRLYVDSLSEMHAGNLLPGETVPERQPYLMVLVQFRDGTEESRLELFRGKGEAPFLGRSTWQPVCFDVDRTVVSQIVKTPFDMQGRRVVDLDIGKIHSVAVTFDDITREAERTERGWREPGGGNDVTGIDMSLWRLNEMKFEAMPLERVSGELRESMLCVLRGGDDQILASLHFYQDPSLPEGQIWLRNGSGLYYPVPSQIVEDLRGLFPFPSGTENNPDS